MYRQHWYTLSKPYKVNNHMKLELNGNNKKSVEWNLEIYLCLVYTPKKFQSESK